MTDARRWPARPSWSACIPTAEPCRERYGEAFLTVPTTASTCWSSPACSSPDGYPEVARLFAAKAEQGVKLRLAMGAPDSDAVRLRGEEERIGDGLAARVRLSLIYLRDAIGAPGVELRFHGTTLYNSIYRFDDDMLVNAHVYGAPAAHSPVLHVRRLPGGRLVDHYQASFERVWEQASADNVPEMLAQRERR